MKRVWGFVLAVWMGLGGAAWSDVSLNALFSDGMVIQRETEAPVWGWAAPGEKVTVSASWGVQAAATAGQDGSWKLMLKTPKAGTGYSITVAGENRIMISDVASGEVWFCGGQSNMDFTMRQIAGTAREPEYQPAADYVKQEMQTAKDSLLRHIEVPNCASPYEKKRNFYGFWKPVDPVNTPLMTATGYFFGRELRKHLKDVPVGLLECAWGGSRVQPWISVESYRADPDMSAHFDRDHADLKRRAGAWNVEDAQEKHRQALEQWKANGEKGHRPQMTPDPAADKQWSAALHNGMVSAVVPYAVKGVIWYQGESNAGYMTEFYEGYFSTLIRSWRAEWGRGDFPFYWAQLAGFRDANPQPLENCDWAVICDQQRRCLNLPNTGMAVLSDLGEAKDIHPRNKVDVGKRLALWALAKDYGVQVPAFSGPLYKSCEMKGGRVLVRFSHAESGLMVGRRHLMDDAVEVDEPLRRFQICGQDRVWKWAHAEIISKDTVEVWHPEITEPAVVRYAWSSNPEGANLYNRAGLPASLFTTE